MSSSDAQSSTCPIPLSQSPETPRPSFANPRQFIDRSPTPDSQRRRAFITDKLAHRVDLALAQTAVMASSGVMGGSNKPHTSPSKASYGRTYDSKLVTREMHRLGNLSHLPTGLAPGLSQAPSVNSLALPAPGSMAQVSLAATTNSDPWGALHVYVLPLFNGEPLRIPIEDLNVLVTRHISSVVSSAPSKAIATLESDAAELIASGMVTLNSKLSGTEDESLLQRVVDIWTFFWDEVLSYVEGAFVPLRTHSLLASLYRNKPHRPSSPRQSSKVNASAHISTPNYIDVRIIALRSFRDKLVVPLCSRLRTCIQNRDEKENEPLPMVQPRLQQMLLVLSSLSRQRPPKLLTAAPPAPSVNEAAIGDLLRTLRSPRRQFDAKSTAASPILTPRAPSFLSAGLPRDRRGRIAQKPNNLVVAEESDEDVFGDETPRITQGLTDRDRGREFLESLRSPELDAPPQGGWGLGPGDGTVEGNRPEEEDDEPLNWDEAQAVVERMVGMSYGQSQEPRRR